jgi:hypothetical protein
MRCHFCKTYFEPRRSDARFCSPAHKAAWHRAEERRQREAALDLLLRQTRAVHDGDTEALSAIADEAARLLPKD